MVAIMKIAMRAMLVLALVAVAFPPQAGVADLEWLGRVSGFVGADRDTSNDQNTHGITLNQDDPAGRSMPFGAAELFGVIPLYKGFGLETQFAAGGGRGSKINLNIGPIWDWGSGKVGFFYLNQWHNYPDGINSDGHSNTKRNMNNAWIRPAASYYLGNNLNIDWTMGIPITRPTSVDGKYGDLRKRYVPYSDMQTNVNFFPDQNLVGNGNLELTLGVVVNNYLGFSKILGVGAGPVFGAAFMPIHNLEVTAFKANIDSRGRFQVLSGLQYYFNFGKAPSTLVQLRRKYLDPTNQPGRISSNWRLHW
jgi:hypothetical protein